MRTCGYSREWGEGTWKERWNVHSPGRNSKKRRRMLPEGTEVQEQQPEVLDDREMQQTVEEHAVHGQNVSLPEIVVKTLLVEMKARAAQVAQLERDKAKLEAASAADKLVFEYDKLSIEAAAGKHLEAASQLLEASQAETQAAREQLEAKKAETEALRVVAREAELETVRSREELQKRKAEIEDARVCHICYERPRDAALLPCNHGQYCWLCVLRVLIGSATCPTCRA